MSYELLESRAEKMEELLKTCSDLIYGEFGSDHRNTIWINDELQRLGIKDWWKKDAS